MENGRRKTEVGRRKSEVRRQKSGDGSWKMAVAMVAMVTMVASVVVIGGHSVV